MTLTRSHLATNTNPKWHRLRQDTGRFPTIAECAIYCLPNLRACARLFTGNRGAGDALIETFLEDLLAWKPAGTAPHTPAGLTLAFEQFLHRHFGRKPQRIALSSNPSPAMGIWMSVDEFLETLTRL
ncbi:MAG: hypothetical protein ACK4M6_07795 [Hyphomonas sp.]